MYPSAMGFFANSSRCLCTDSLCDSVGAESRPYLYADV
jgi:hypothetical protein